MPQQVLRLHQGPMAPELAPREGSREKWRRRTMWPRPGLKAAFRDVRSHPAPCRVSGGRAASGENSDRRPFCSYSVCRWRGFTTSSCSLIKNMSVMSLRRPPFNHSHLARNCNQHHTMKQALSAPLARLHALPPCTRQEHDCLCRLDWYFYFAHPILRDI